MSSVRPPAPTIRTTLRRALFLAVPGAAWFVLMMAMYQGHWGFGAADQPVHDWAVGIRTPFATALLAALTTVTGPTWMTAISAVVGFGWMLWRREWRRPLVFLASMLVAVLCSSLIKHELSRARPDPAFMVLGPEASPAFPSGHTLGSAVFALVLAYLLTVHTGRRRAVVGLGLAALLPLAVGFSRIYLGYHWLTDVLASLGLALVVLAAATVAEAWLDDSRSNS
ncbi:phosphatase PAP2 family protein [Arthrobacter sp. NPDC090010]|uniref:phosphatase PAP2 family protein n=1 Tax=Arthrobacter sp. NPDC090010 TaxID=3363942 RepID=UPI0038083B02